jgi:hypothetical protein
VVPPLGSVYSGREYGMVLTMLLINLLLGFVAGYSFRAATERHFPDTKPQA